MMEYSYWLIIQRVGILTYYSTRSYQRVYGPDGLRYRSVLNTSPTAHSRENDYTILMSRA